MILINDNTIPNVIYYDKEVISLHFIDRSEDDVELYGKSLMGRWKGRFVKKSKTPFRVVRHKNGDWFDVGSIGDRYKIRDVNVTKQLEIERIKALEYHKKYINLNFKY